MFVYPAGPESSKERQKGVYCLFIRQGQKVKKKGKRLFIVCLSRRAGKVKRGQKLLIVYSSCRAGKFKRKAKSCLLFVYAAGRESLKEGKKVVYCLFIRQFKRGNMLLIGYLSVRARKLKESQKSCLLFVYRAGTGSLKERQKIVFVCLSSRARK